MSHNVVQETERRHIGLRMEGRNMDLRYLEEVVHSSLKIEREEGELSPMPETEDWQNTLFAHASNVVSGTDTMPRGEENGANRQYRNRRGEDEEV